MRQGTTPPNVRTLAGALGSGIGPAARARPPPDRRPSWPSSTSGSSPRTERAERRAQDREYARHAVEQLRSSDGWNAWLTARASFRNYSLGNQLLIAMARPTATRVAGFRAWLKLGYSVQKRPDDVPEGAWAIKIWAPCPPSRKQLERWQQNGANPERAATNVLQARPGLRQVISCSVRRCRRRPSREIRCLPVSRLCCSSARQRHAGGDGLGLRGRRGAGARRATAQRRSRARLAGDPSANRGAMSRRRECRHRVPTPGNLADRRQVAEGCRLARDGARRPARAIVAGVVRFR